MLGYVQPDFSQSSFSGSDNLGSDDDMSVSTVQNNISVRGKVLHECPPVQIKNT